MSRCLACLLGVITAAAVLATPCTTIASGTFTDPAIWDCGCDALTCDTLYIDHEVVSAGDLMITAHLLRLGASGSMTVSGDLDIESDSLYNYGAITSSDTLILGNFNATINHGTLLAGFCYQQNVLYNYGSSHFLTGFASFGLVNVGMINGGGAFALYSTFFNEIGSEIATDSVFIFGEQSEVRGPIIVDSAFYVGNQFTGGELSVFADAGASGAIICRGDLYNYGTVNGNGPICIARHSENHGALNGGIDFCDATPPVSGPPFIDVNDGTVWSGVGFCETDFCPTIMTVGEQQALQRVQVVPNPANGQCQILLPAGLVVASYDLIDAQGRTVRHMSFPSSGELLIEAPATAGTYSLVLRTRGGARVVRSMVFLP